MERVYNHGLQILLKDRNLEIGERAKFENEFRECVDSLNIPDDISDNDLQRFYDKLEDSRAKGGVNIGIYLNFILTGSFVQADLNQIHSIGKKSEAVNLGKVKALDYVNYTGGKMANVIVKVRISKSVRYEQMEVVAKSLVLITVEDIIEEFILAPSSALNKFADSTTNISKTFKIIFNRDKMDMYGIDLSLVYDMMTAYYKKTKLSKVIWDKASGDNYFIVNFTARPMDGKIVDLKKDAMKVRIRGNIYILDMILDYVKDLEVYFLVRDNYESNPDTKTKNFGYSRVMKNLKLSPYINEIISINHGRSFSNYYGIVATFVKLIDFEDELGYKKIFIHILAFMLTLTGQLLTMRNASKDNTDSLSKSLKGKSLNKMVKQIFEVSKKNIPLSSIAHANVFGTPRNGKKSSLAYREIHSLLFNNTTILSEKVNLTETLFSTYQYNFI